MKKCKKLFLLVYFIYCGAVFAQNTEKKNVILIGWDGAQRNHVNECLKAGQLPVLKKLISEGNKVDIDINGTTDTKAGWSQILTGYMPEISGVYSNGNYKPIPKGYTVGERLKTELGSDFISVYIIGKKGHVDSDSPKRIEITENIRDMVFFTKKARKNNPDFNREKVKNLKKKYKAGKLIEEDGRIYIDMPGKPYYYSKDGIDLYINGLVENEKVMKEANDKLEKFKDKQFFFFIHFAEVDHQGHKFGENSIEYTNALISSDANTRKIIEKLKSLNLYDKTYIYVTADHGFDEGEKSHKYAPYVFLASNDKEIKRNGKREDISPTIYDRLGIDPGKFIPPLDGKSLIK